MNGSHGPCQTDPQVDVDDIGTENICNGSVGCCIANCKHSTRQQVFLIEQIAFLYRNLRNSKYQLKIIVSSCVTWNVSANRDQSQ